MIKRIYVEKKQFNSETSHAFEDIRQVLQISGLSGLRLLNRYDVELDCYDENIYSLCKHNVFSERAIDNVYDEEFPHSKDDFVFAVKYLPGQYDQRADSAVQCINIVAKADALVESAKVYVCEGTISDSEKERIKEYFINPVDSVEASLDKPQTLILKVSEPEKVRVHAGFTKMTDTDAIKLRDKLGLAMSSEDLLFCRDYFSNTEQRDPTATELSVIDTYWSDHCRHTTFLTKLKNIEFADGLYSEVIKDAYNLYLKTREELNDTSDVCLMDIAVLAMKALRAKGVLDDIDESDEINACSIKVKVDVDGVYENWLIMFKNETHNHPTEIEPFGGAATCLGGAIRDPLSGRAFVYQAMRVTGSGNPLTPYEDTLPGKLPQRKITTGAAHGYSSYGNQIGLATGHVAEIYDDGYVAKRMEIGAVIGAVKQKNVVRKTPKCGDIVILVGGRTGRDGCGGATGSSKEHTEDSLSQCGAEVQKGNPPTERKLQRLFRNPSASRLIKKCNDFGAGGVAVAIGELADGLEIDLSDVPKKYEGLDGTELAISESQERMAVVVENDNVEKFCRYAEAENLEATAVAEVTDTRRLVMKWRGDTIVDISRDFLDSNGASHYADVLVGGFENARAGYAKINARVNKQSWIDNLRELNVASQKGLVERFDSTVCSGTVLMPFGGVNQLTPAEVMAAKIPVGNSDTDTASIMSFGYDPCVANKSPFHSAMYAVVESISKIVAAGGNCKQVRLSFQEYFEKTSSPEKWGKPFSALLGAFTAQMNLDIPAIGGKDSMSGSFKDINVPPTLVSFAVCVDNIKNIISNEFKAAGNALIKIKARYSNGDVYDFDYLKKSFDKINQLIKNKRLISVGTIGKGGVAAVVSKMSLGNGIGAEIYADKNSFVADYGSFICESTMSVDETNKELSGLDFEIIGKTCSDKSISCVSESDEFSISLEEIEKEWMEPLERVFPTDYYASPKQDKIEVPLYTSSKIKPSRASIVKPRVFIPVFPGTNCEYDIEKAFLRAGGVVDQLIIRNFRTDWLNESITRMAEKIRDSQIIAIPGGFSAGDEPDGSGKFITAVFRNPAIMDATMELLKNRDGLIIGICNGFQALIKLGLISKGAITEMDENSPTLTYNSIGRHVSCFAKTKIISNKSPWLWNTNPGDEFMIPISHGEGRFIANSDIIDDLSANNQIATQYVNLNGEPVYDIRYNPNGSMYAIEGLTSADGRVFGKMGHSERIGHGLYKNIPGEKDQKIFEAGISYFV